MHFYLIFGFLGFKDFNKTKMNVFKGSDDFGFRILSGWIEKYKPALSKSASSSKDLYCVRLVIVSIDVNVGRLLFLVSDDNFFGCVFFLT